MPAPQGWPVSCTLPAHRRYIHVDVQCDKITRMHFLERKLTGCAVPARVKQQIIANAEPNSAHKYNSYTAKRGRIGVKLTSRTASIQN